MYTVSFTSLIRWIHSLGNQPLNKWLSHHLYPGLTSKQTVLLIKVHLQPPDSSNGPFQTACPFRDSSKEKGKLRKEQQKKRGHHKLFSKLPSTWPNATCLPIVWGLPLLRGEKTSWRAVFQMPLALQSLPLIGLCCSALPSVRSAYWVSSISQHFVWTSITVRFTLYLHYFFYPLLCEMMSV